MFKQFVDAIEMKMIKATMALKKSERGDTNFISILIILGLVILLAGVFIGFKDKIVTEVTGIVNGFSISGNGSSPTP